jgi:hypothetical protein
LLRCCRKGESLFSFLFLVPLSDFRFCKWRVAQILSLSYQAVCSKNPYDTLQFLLKNGKETLSLAHSFISQNNMSSPKVAGILADIFYKALLEHQEKARIGIPSGRGNTIDPFCSTVDFAELVNLSMVRLLLLPFFLQIHN